MDPAQSVWPTNENFEVMGAGEGEIAFVADAIADSEITATHDVDVVVCGLGHSGSATALACAEAGLKTVVVEKASVGNYNSATIGGTTSRYHKHWGVEYPEGDFIADAALESSYQGNLDLYRHWFANNGEAVDWYIGHLPNQNLDDYPLSFNENGSYPDFREPYEKTALTRSWNMTIALPYQPTELRDMFADFIVEAGGEIRYNTPACQLIAEDGKVTGVIVKGESGYEKYNCAKGVVLSTGGYEFNPEMIKQRCRPRNVPGRWLTGVMGNTGDGQQMGLAVGAIEDDYPQSIMLDPSQLMSFMRVNALGKRFMPEIEPYSHMAMGVQLSRAVMTTLSWTARSLTRWITSGPQARARAHFMAERKIRAAAAMGENALKADTLKNLLSSWAFRSMRFVATMKRWNEMAANGVDEDFANPEGRLMPIDTPPYYATKESSCGLCTVGGLIVDENCRVLNAERTPIEGLFATGITSGGLYFNTYPHNLNCISHTHNVLMAYTIGKFLSE